MLEIIINRLVFSKLYYCSLAWSSTSACNVGKLQYVQNFAARIICNVRKYDHIASVLRKLRWLPVKTDLYYRDATLTCNCMTGKAPEHLTSSFVTKGSISGRTTTGDASSLSDNRDGDSSLWAVLCYKDSIYKGLYGNATVLFQNLKIRMFCE